MKCVCHLDFAFYMVYTDLNFWGFVVGFISWVEFDQVTRFHAGLKTFAEV